jgi:hypothetical protein
LLAAYSLVLAVIFRIIMSPVWVLYENWKYVTSWRKIIPEKIWEGKTEYHPENTWLLHAWDCDKKEYRDFDMSKIKEWKKTDPKGVIKNG